MRKIYLLVACLIFMSFAHAEVSIKPLMSMGSAKMSGFLDTSTVPFRLFINYQLQNEEVLFLRLVSSENAILYESSYVTLEGNIDLFQEIQYIMSVSSIKEATPQEIKSTYLSNLK